MSINQHLSKARTSMIISFLLVGGTQITSIKSQRGYTLVGYLSGLQFAFMAFFLRGVACKGVLRGLEIADCNFTHACQLKSGGEWMRW